MLIIIAAIYFIFPALQFNLNDPVPDENLIPDPIEDLTSFASEIEDLELTVFQKDQKIKFRDGQINNLQNQLKDTKTQLEISIKELNKIKGLYETLTLTSDDSVPSDELNILQDKFNALNKENEKNISKINDLNNQIKDLDNSLLSVDQNQKDVSMANPEDVKKITGYTIGGVSPTGNLTKIKIFIDETLNRFSSIFAAAGHPNEVFDINFENLIALTSGEINEITE